MRSLGVIVDMRKCEGKAFEPFDDSPEGKEVLKQPLAAWVALGRHSRGTMPWLEWEDVEPIH